MDGVTCHANIQTPYTTHPSTLHTHPTLHTLHTHPTLHSEIDIVAIEPRPDAPEWMVEETHLKRQGLLTLRRNVVLLRDEEDSDKFYPVCVWRVCVGVCCVCFLMVHCVGVWCICGCMWVYDVHPPTYHIHFSTYPSHTKQNTCKNKTQIHKYTNKQNTPTHLHSTYTQRFNLHLTQSYHDLNPWWQKELRQLHDDYMYHRQVCVCVLPPSLQIKYTISPSHIGGQHQHAHIPQPSTMHTPSTPHKTA